MEKLNAMVVSFLGRVIEATDGEQGYMNSNAKSVEKLESLGYIEVNRSDSVAGEKGEPAVRVTEAGRNAYDELTTKEKEVKTMTAQVAIASNVEMPKAPSRGRSGSMYPFDQLEPGQAFFVPATGDKPNPVKTLASAVTNARKKYAVETGGTVIRKIKGEEVEVPETEKTRDFQVREVADGAAFGEQFAGVSGAGVWRTM